MLESVLKYSVVALIKHLVDGVNDQVKHLPLLVYVLVVLQLVDNLREEPAHAVYLRLKARKLLNAVRCPPLVERVFNNFFHEFNHLNLFVIIQLVADAGNRLPLCIADDDSYKQLLHILVHLGANFGHLRIQPPVHIMQEDLPLFELVYFAQELNSYYIALRRPGYLSILGGQDDATRLLVENLFGHALQCVGDIA